MNSPLVKDESSSQDSSTIEEPIIDCDMESMSDCEGSPVTVQGGLVLREQQSEFKEEQPLNAHESSRDKDKMTSDTLFSFLNILRSAIAEVVAFPTHDNFQRLLKHSKAAHDAYMQFGREVELGKSQNETNDIIAVVDTDTRSKLNTIGTTLWNLIGKHSEIFIDAGHDLRGKINDPAQSEQMDLAMCRTIASGYIRSIAGRMILIDKLYTSRSVPRLVPSDSSSDHSVPLALASELEFGLSVFARAGRAFSQSQNINHSSSKNVAYSHLDYMRVSQDTLLLALECWKALCHVHQYHSNNHNSCSDSSSTKENGDNDSMIPFPSAGISDHTKVKAFEVLILLPDIMSELVVPETRGGSEFKDQDHQHTLHHPVLTYLVQLNDFVSEELRVVENMDWECILYTFQRYIPPLAKISYKHGNRLARIQEYDSAKEALQISLNAADKLKDHIAFVLDVMLEKKASSITSSVTRSSLEINRSEMLVISKQIFYVLSSVFNSRGMFKEANEYLDRIESFIDEMCRREKELYSKTLDELASNETNDATSSSFTLEAPRRQDAAQIRMRADATRMRTKVREAKERIFLSYHRIRYLQKEQESLLSLSSQDFETNIDKHFLNMLDWVKHLSHDSNEKMFSELEDVECMNVQNCHDLILSIARSVTSKRLLITDVDRVSCIDLYTALINSVQEESVEQLQFCLEAFDTCLLAAANIRDTNETSQPSDIALCKALDHRVKVMGYDLSNRLRSFVFSSSVTNTGNNLVAPKPKVLPAHENTIDTLLEKARNYCAKALSLYQSHQNYEQTIEWCDIFLKVNEVWRLNKTSKGDNPVSDVDWDNINAGVIAVKAIAQSSSGDHGSGIKLAREAWSKNGAQLCNFLALFICAFKYESSSVVNFDEESSHHAFLFENTILELDNAFTTFSSLSKLENDKVTVENISDTFQTMSHLASGHVMLEIAIQMRWLKLSVESIRSNRSYYRYEKNTNIVTVFSILQPYLCNLEKLLESWPSDIDFERIFTKFTELKASLEDILHVIRHVRDSNSESKRNSTRKNEYDMALEDDFTFGLEESKSEKTEAASFFDNNAVVREIGSDRQCLWVGEQLWNIGNLLLKSDAPDTLQASKRSILAAYLFRCAHDFVFLSEEEDSESLTKGHLACEGFTYGTSVKYNVISLPCKTQSSDLCSEFSYQALLLSSISVVEALNQQSCYSEQKRNEVLPSLERSREIEISIQCLNAALAECYTVGQDSNTTVRGIPLESVTWIYLNLLIHQTDDIKCVNALEKGGLLGCLQEQVHSTISVQGFDDNKKECFERLLHFSYQAETFRMISSARILYSICLEWMKSMDIVSYEITGSCNTISVGSLYRKLIGMSRSVHEIVSVFDTIDKAMTNFTKTKRSEKDTAQVSSVPFSVQDVDYFIVEAHNRAVTLIGIGDTKSSEKLLAVAMNLLAHCSKEVENYGSDIRRTYRNVLSKIGIGGFTLSF